MDTSTPEVEYDADGSLKNGIDKGSFVDGTLSWEGAYHAGERTGEWKTYDASGALIKTKQYHLPATKA